MEYSIGDFSTISRLGIKTLRYYHEIGLLLPSRVDPLTGYRFYNQDCLAQVRAIQRLKELDFSLIEIREILAHRTPDETLLQVIQGKLAEIERRIAADSAVRDRLAAFVHSEALPLIFPDAVIEKDAPELQVASIRFRGRYVELGDQINCLYAAAGDAACGAPFSLYYDDHSREEDADIEICVAVNRTVETGETHTRRIPAERVLSILHHGSYDQLWISYQALVDELNQRQRSLRLPTREIYLVGGAPAQAAAERGFLTEIQFPIA